MAVAQVQGAVAQVQGTDGNRSGCTSSWDEALEDAQLDEDRHQGESGRLHGCRKERRRRPRLKKEGGSGERRREIFPRSQTPADLLWEPE